MSNSDKGPLAGLSILIVEDEFLIAAEIQHVVQAAGAGNARLVNSIADARRSLDVDEIPDLVVLDLVLGREHGSVLVQELQERRIPFVIASGFSLGSEPFLQMKGAIDREVVVAKPFTEPELIEAMVAALRRVGR